MSRWARSMRSLLLVLGTLFVSGLIAAPSAGASSEGVVVIAHIGGHDVAQSSSSDPVNLNPNRVTTLRLSISNQTQHPITIETVRIQGSVLGLTFFAYQITVNDFVRAGGRQHDNLPINLTGLSGEAKGLMGGSVALIRPDGSTLASVPLVSNVEGSIWSIYGVFGLLIALLTLIGLLVSLILLGRGKLPRNRLVRSLRFGAPGLGLGFTIIFTLSATGVLSPAPDNEITILLVTTVVGLVAGYLTPTPLLEDDTDDPVEAEETEETKQLAVEH
jgi:hypothetical protein